MAWTRRRKKLKKRGDFLQSSTISLSCFGMSEISHLFSICNSLTLNLARWHCSVRYGSALSLLYCQATLGLSRSHLSRPVFTPKALFIGWIITPLGLTKWQHPFFFEVLKILGSQIIPHPFSYDTFFFWVWKILGPQPITIVFLPCED